MKPLKPTPQAIMKPSPDPPRSNHETSCATPTKTHPPPATTSTISTPLNPLRLPARFFLTFFPSPGSMLVVAARAGFNLKAISIKLAAFFEKGRLFQDKMPPRHRKLSAFPIKTPPLWVDLNPTWLVTSSPVRFGHGFLVLIPAKPTFGQDTGANATQQKRNEGSVPLPSCCF